jgi:hypothetical protein
MDGDLVGVGTSEEQWDEWFDDWHELMITPQGRRIPLLTAIGNHEVRGGKTPAHAPYYYNRIPLPGAQSYYALRFGPHLSVVTLDSGHTTPLDGAQLDWLRQTLEEHKNSTWLIMHYHVPAYPSVRDYDGAVSTAIRRLWVPLFEQYGAQLAVEAHDHSFKRTHPIRDGKVDPQRGIVYIGDGSWGVPPRPTKKLEECWWLREVASAEHYWRITLPPDAASLLVEPIFLKPQPDLGAPFTLRKP